LDAALLRAIKRFGSLRRRSRSDCGHSRLPALVEARLCALLRRQERPSVGRVHAQLQRFCGQRGFRVPSRGTVYNAMARVEPPRYAATDLPEQVRRVLHNVGSESIPGHQIVFAAFNYGDTRALSFAAGMPWTCLYHAARVPGFRPKSLALLRAVMAHRGI
jgi:hypothetical protein